jgi:hypothetical protein
MASAQQANTSGDGKRQRGRRSSSKRPPRLLLWYWASALRHDSRWARTAYIQPAVGVVIAIVGVLVGAGGLMSPSLVAELAGAAIAVLGAVIAAISYPISVYYSFEYPGKFDERLEEYVARRVSRLSKDKFIPHYKTHDNAANRKISDLKHRVRLALKVEKLRLKQSERTGSSPICGIVVVGPKHTNKTGALWFAMERELRGWTFVKWPHHMDHPANLASRLGHRVVLWIDSLQDFARPGEAAALNQFIQQLRDNGQLFLVLSSCRDEQDQHDFQEAQRYFSPLIADLQQVRATGILPPTQQLDNLKRAYKDDLSEMQRGVLRTMDWLQSMHIFTYPGEVLNVLNKYFLKPGVESDDDLTWDAVIQGLGKHSARFVRVDQRAEAQTRLSGERYDFGRWFRNNFFRNFFRNFFKKRAQRPHKVIEPLNAHYLNLEDLDQEGSRAERAQTITSILEQQPEAVIKLLAGFPVAAETLILLGDAYLNHLGEAIDNAGELAIECYTAAFQILDAGMSPKQFPGGWAAALIGNGTAELRVGDTQKADAEFSKVIQRPVPTDDARPIPPLLTARAWHGRGDVIAAKIPSDEAAAQLQDAADYYEKAAQLLPSRDPLRSETVLDHANVLFEIAQAAYRRYEQSLSTTPIQPPIGVIDTAQNAYQEANQAYSQTIAPAVWAETKRRQGELCRMMATSLLPAEMQLLRRAATNKDITAVNPLADEENALKTAKIGRDYFIAARNVLAPSYLPMAWSQTQVGLASALLIIARIVAQSDNPQARRIYSLCLETTKITVEKVSKREESPIDWVDLQLLRAQAEVGLGSLGEGDAPGQYLHANSILKKVEILLNDFKRLPGNPESARINAQIRTLESLREEIKQAPIEA